MRRSLPSNRGSAIDTDRSSLQSGRPPTYASNVTAPPTYTGTHHPNDRVRAWSASVPSASVTSAPDSETLLDETESSLVDTMSTVEISAEVTSPTGPRYIYYRVYAEDGALPSKTSASPDDPFLGRIKATSVPPPHTVNSLKRRLAKSENINDHTRTSLFLTPSSQSPMDGTGKVTILNPTGLGSIPQEPLAIVAKLSDSERTALDSEGMSDLASTLDHRTISPNTRYLYYRLYTEDCEMPSKVAIDPEEPSLGRIHADAVAPPHTPTSVRRCISRVERLPELSYANLFADISCDTPLTNDHISILHTDGPGLNLNQPMAIVQVSKPMEETIPLSTTLIPDGTYTIKNRAGGFLWGAGGNLNVYFGVYSTYDTKTTNWLQWYITHDTNGHILLKTPFAPSSWVGANMTGSTVPVPWRLIPESPGSKFYYLTTDMDHNSQNLQVPTISTSHPTTGALGKMSPLKKSDETQMWEFIRI